MELLLNLVWLLLAVPAYWLWHRGAGAGARRRFNSLQCLLALGCLLVLLFPVISATDDLHAMRAEMEESGPSKRSIQQAGSDKASGWNQRWQSAPAIVAGTPAFALSLQGWLELSSPSSLIPAAPSILGAGRAPPSLILV